MKDSYFLTIEVKIPNKNLENNIPCYLHTHINLQQKLQFDESVKK